MDEPVDLKAVSKCIDCHVMINPKTTGVYWEGYGWTEYRGAVGGSSSLRLKRWTGRVMCAACYHNRKHGVKSQVSLFED